VGGWQRVVYAPRQVQASGDGSLAITDPDTRSDSPLPLALGQVVAPDHPLHHLLVGVGLLGLIASFNGIILASGRAVFEMGRVGFLPHCVGHTNPVTKTPAAALILNLVVGITAILFFDTGGLITISAFGAVTLYIVSMLALMRLRRIEPDLPRPYRTPWYPFFPIVAIGIATLSLITMTALNIDWANPARSYSLWYFASLAVAFLYFFTFVDRHLTPEDIAHFRRID